MTSFRLLCQCLIVTCLLATFSHERAVVIETGPVYDYVYVDDYGVYVTQGRQMSFNIRASNDAHIALARLKYNTTVDAYEVVIGGWYNQRSTIRPCDQCPTDWWVDQRLLNETYPMPFWVTWALNVSGGLTIRTGSGYVVLQNEFMSWYDPDPHDINYVGVSTGWASNGTWIFEVVDGGWSSWGSWTPCSSSCGSGIRARERRCNNPTPDYGRPCNDTPRQYQPCNNTAASCLGAWTGWSSWGQCSVTCGAGQQTRTRRCLTSDRPCPGSNTDQLPCLMDPCQVDGQWSMWSTWSVCSASCGQSVGWSYRNRSCINPPPQYGGLDCRGNITDASLCNLFNCSMNGSWSEWQAWTNCSANCGNGTKTRTRQCTDLRPLEAGGASCVGNDTEEDVCFQEPCPLNGNWSEWQPWSSCSASCGNGTRGRHRQCNDPLPQSGGAPCVGNGSEESQCIVTPCLVGGQWAAWSIWSVCSVPCGGGVSSRTRQCNAPSPQLGGAECNGSGIEDNMCNNQSCTAAVDGVWSTWSSWSDCSRTCSIGQRVRHRSCSHPPPSGGGLNCSGSDTEVVNCKMDDCQTNSATWSVWSDWTVCPVSCGSGVQSRFRVCEEPDVNWDGLPCDGNGNETSICNDVSCPVDGEWSEWSAWSPSCPPCGPGVTYRQRNCSNPVPLYDGTNCSGTSQEQTNCTTNPCPVDGEWSEWSSWSPSCPSCGPGVTYRQRNCSNPVPLYGGTNCSGASQEQTNCSTIPCPVDGGWSAWTSWSPPCPVCGSGVTYRQRNCSNPFPLYGGMNCSGASDEAAKCTTNPCPVAGGWSEWSAWSSCPSCGSGLSRRFRNCSNPEPMYGGSNCSGASIQRNNCTGRPCPVNGAWTQWTAWSNCSVTCESGIANRFRNCSNPRPQNGGNNCVGNETDVKKCTLQSCPMDGAWSMWTNWADCNVTCGSGWTTRKRSCNNPTPFFGGLACPGPVRDSKTCSINCPASQGGGKSVPQTMEAPGAQAIGVIGIAICVALIAAIMLLDLVSINKHFAFMKKNVNYGWQRIVTKFRPLADDADASKSQQWKTVRRSTVRRAYTAGRRDPVAKEALAEQQSVTLKRTVSGGPEGGAAKSARVERIGGTLPVLAPRPGKRPLAAMGSGNLDDGTMKGSGGRFEKSLDAFKERGVATTAKKEEELDTKL